MSLINETDEDIYTDDLEVDILKGLLYKDFYLIRNNILIGMGIILGVSLFAVILVLGMTKGNFKSISEDTNIFNMFFKGAILIVAGTGIYTALSSASAIDSDDKSGWFRVLYSSPVTALQEVVSRYLLALIVNTLMTAWAAIIIPFIYFAGNKGYGMEEVKLIVCCWLFGILMIFIRLPIDIVFPAKVSTAISVGIISAILFGLMVWITVAGDTKVFDCILRGVRFVYKYGVAFVAGTVMISFTSSYLGKKNRRWA